MEKYSYTPKGVCSRQFNFEIEDGIIHLKAKGEIVIEDRDDDTEWVYLESFYNTEVAICNRLNKLDETLNSKKVKE